MQNITNEKRFLSYSVAFGVIIGLTISAILEAIATPETSRYLLTIQEQADFAVLAARIDQAKLFMMAASIASCIYIFLLLPVLNPQITLSIRKEPKKLLRLGVFILAAILITIGLASRLDSFFGSMDTGLFLKISGVAIPIVWWSILGEIGIAGDLSSWKPVKPDIRTCIILALSAYLLFVVLQLANDWGFSWFYPLVSEVLDGSGETSLRGFNWLRGGIVFLSTCTALTASAIIVGFAPVNIPAHERISKLVLPVSMTIGFTLILTGIYYIGVMNYDLDKQSLAEAIGAEQVTSQSHTAILQGDAVTSNPWPQNITPFCMTDCGPIPVSTENIDLLEGYLQDQPNSVFQYGAADAIVKSWFHLWQSNQATTSQQQTQNDVLQRMIFLNRLACLPITPENQEFLKQYGDESKWWVGSKSALLLARAAIHFNSFDTAGTWLEIAKERGGSEEALATTIPQEAQLVTGVISGSITSTRPVMIGLFRAGDEDREINLDTTYLSLNMVDSRLIEGTAPFSFTNIGEGRYFLALKYDGKVADIKMDTLTTIELSKKTARVDVGRIVIQ